MLEFLHNSYIIIFMV